MEDKNQQNQESNGAEQGEELKTENLEALAGEFEPAGEAGKETGPDVDALGAEELANLAELGFGALAGLRGGHWAISKEEAQKLGTAGDRCIRHYFGDANMGPGGTMIAVAAMVTLPRLVADIAITKAKKQQAANDDGQQQGTGTHGD